MSGPSSPSVGSLQLTIRLTTHPINPVPSYHTITISRAASILQLKQQLHTEWDGKPEPTGIVCVKGGRVCRDQEVLGELFGAEIPASDAVLHVIVRPNSWSAPFVSLPRPTPTVPAEATTAAAPLSPLALPTVSNPAYNPSYTVPPPTESSTPTPEILRNTFTSDLGSPPPPPAGAQIPSSASLGPNVAGFPTYLAFLSQLIPLQRSLLLLNLQKAHYFYSIDVTERLARLGWAESTGSKIDPIVIKEEGEDVEAFKLREEREKEKMRKEMEEGNGEVQEVKGLLTECGLWGMVKEKEEEAESEIRDWGKERREQNGEFQLVQIGGLPFMLQVPPTEQATLSPPPPLALYRALKRGQAILHILTTMLQLLITYQPSAPAIAYGRALLRPPGPAPGVGGVAAGAARAAAAAAIPPPALGAAAVAAANRRRATVSIVINLEAVLSLIIPLFLLSLKLGFLLWIFGRHASYTKRVVMGSMAAAWILWEGWGMYRRRAIAGALRERADRERERAERQARRVEVAAQAGIQLPAAAPRRPPPPGAAPVGAGGGELRQRAIAGGAPPAGPPPPPAVAGHRPNRLHGVRPRREPHSRFSPRYWIARIATVGLVEEAHELGLAPRTVAGRQVPQPIPPPHPNDRVGLARQARRRAVRTAMVAVVLFFGTLSPEVERKRKRALEKRERLLAEKRVQRERQAAERAAAASGGGLVVVRPPGLLPPETRSGASTPGLFEGDHSEATHGLPQIPPPAATSPVPSAPSSPPVASTSAAPSTSQPTSPTATSTPPTVDQPSTAPAGRAVVSDAELFADGLGEPDQEPAVASEPGAPAVEVDTEGSGGEGDAHEVETETDDEEEQRAQEDDGEVDQVVALF
ncbi:hypothetical protein BCR35DRAFT_324552 [Leucosporidium creatinivorum]|uniref:Ubiquitin-like domain-containing protein n=1 Tax=Leucosporidium creatinivorum TaxID=106004 RepID=A0A1Y2FRQ5_9BASI|nr:hypothetical protein BCR35DRAFT_324552 [Leucosporidium creatinivorum]